MPHAIALESVWFQLKKELCQFYTSNALRAEFFFQGSIPGHFPSHHITSFHSADDSPGHLQLRLSSRAAMLVPPVQVRADVGASGLHPHVAKHC